MPNYIHSPYNGMRLGTRSQLCINTYKMKRPLHLFVQNLVKKKLKSSKAFAIASFIFVTIVEGHELLASQQRIRFNSLTIDNGLSHNHVYSCLQDQYGFIWFGTEAGLNRYDGLRFKIFSQHTTGSSSFAGTSAGALLLDHQGLLWIATWGDGLVCFDPKTDQFWHYYPQTHRRGSIRAKRVQSLYETRNGFLWVGGYQSGLERMDPSTRLFQTIPFATNEEKRFSPNSRVWAICENDKGRLWIGTGGGLFYLDPDAKQLKRAEAFPELRTAVKALLYDQTGNLWIGTKNGLRALTSTHEEHQPTWPTIDQPLLPKNDVRALLQDSLGRIWIGTNGDGLFLWDPLNEKLEHFQHHLTDRSGLTHNRIESLFEDRSGVLWVTTSGGGINKLYLTPKNFKHYSNHLFPNRNNEQIDISAIYEDSQGILWIGTYGQGLNAIHRESGQTWSYFTQTVKNSLLRDNIVRALTEDSRGNLWIGTYNGGLSILEPNRQSFYHFEPSDNKEGLSHFRIRALYRDSKGQMWVGTEAGLDLFLSHENRFQQEFASANSELTKQFGRIYTILESQESFLWLGGENGLASWDPEQKAFRLHVGGSPQVQSLKNVHSLFEETRDRLWIGAYGGLYLFEPYRKSISLFQNEDKRVREVYGVLADSNAKLWISSSLGLSSFDLKTNRFHDYDTKDGLQSNVFTQGAFFQNTHNEMFFGGAEGFNSFFPNQIQNRTHKPSVVLTGFHVFNKELRFDKPIFQLDQLSLHHSQNVFSIEFAALDFVAPEKNYYAYQLQGFDKTWISAGQQHSATYTNLDPGTYTFKVKGSNSDGIWNEEPARLRIIITPPFWRTLWFLSLIILAALALFSFRARSIRKNTKLLENRVEERTKSLRESNKNLTAIAQELRQTQEQLVESAHQAGMAEIASDVMHNLGNALNSVNISVTLLRKNVQHFRPDFLGKLLTLFEQHQDDLFQFLTSDAGGAFRRRDSDRGSGSSGLGIGVISTSKGIMTGHKARRQKLGGELLALVW